MEYAELHCHSAFSLLDGASNPEELVARAREIGLAALALTDHDDMGGAVRFAQAAKELSLPGIIGAELSMVGDYHITALARNLEGYKNICQLITLARTKNKRGSPRISFEQLEEYSKGIIILSGCPHGEIPSLLAAGESKKAVAVAKRFYEIAGDNFFLELWNHNLHQESIISKELLELSKQSSLPWVVTNNVHYAYPEKRIIHDVLTCLRHGQTLATAGRRLRANGSWYLKSPQEIWQQWHHYPEGIKNTLLIAERCEFRLSTLQPELPVINIEERLAPLLSDAKPQADSKQQNKLVIDPKDLLPDSDSAPTSRVDQNLAKLVAQGAALRYVDRYTEKHRQQLKHELDLIVRLKLAPYFLIMWDIVSFAADKNIMVQGRGSAANSAVCYCLKITAIDPISMDLLFERFISEDRNEPPDIDLDIAHKDREKVLQYVYDKYGREHAAMVCEHITYRGPSAVRDAARVFGFSQEQAEKLSEQANYREAKDAAEALLNGGAQRAGLDIKDLHVQLMIQVIAGLHQLPRHRSIHVGGFVLSGEPIGSIVPVEPASMPGRTIIQWDKDDIDLAGLIKIDLLGLGILTMIQDAIKLVKEYRGEEIKPDQLFMDDQEVYKDFRKADTIGIFQIESRAQMNILPQIAPKEFHDLVVSIALIRPGPIQGNMVHPYLKRRLEQEETTYLHPSLEPILNRTYGVPIFQEQGMKIAIAAAGFNASQADQLRRIMSHKRSQEKIVQVCDELREGMKKNGLSDEASETIIFQLKAFSNYGFPESHSASFALLAYLSAHIKHYYPSEFYCATLNAQPMGFYSPGALLRDAIRHGVEIRPVDIAHSFWDCSLEKKSGSNDPALRIGFKHVTGLGAKARESLKRIRTKSDRFSSIEDFCRSSGLSRSDLETLAKIGAFETLCPDRRQAIWQILKFSRNKRENPLLNLLDQHNKNNAALFPSMSDLEKTEIDYRLMGLSAGNHPMSYWRDWALKNGIKRCAELQGLESGTIITVAGGTICRQRPPTAKGFVFLTIEDTTGTADIIIKPQIFETYKDVILKNSFLAIRGRLQIENKTVNMIALSFKPLPALPIARQLSFASHDFH